MLQPYERLLSGRVLLAVKLFSLYADSVCFPLWRLRKSNALYVSSNLVPAWVDKDAPNLAEQFRHVTTKFALFCTENLILVSEKNI